MKPKHPTSIRLFAEGKRLLKLLADKWGVSQLAVLEFLIRQQAKQEKIE